ncbi:hypothetical protein TURU_160789 [Turdus rufiventris]|nr:hypothetical protein TURU_160789 [Turdus rufiventris]
MIRRMEHISYKGRLRKLRLFSREERRFWCDQILAFQYLKEPTKKMERDFLQGPGVTELEVMTPILAQVLAL